MKKKKKKKRLLIILLLIVIGFLFSIKNNTKVKIKDKDFIEMIINNSFENNNIIDKIITKTIEITNPVKLWSINYKEEEKIKEVSNTNKSPTIYLYITHQSEEYVETYFQDISINPTVIMNNYIIEDILKKNGYEVIVEEQSIKDILNQNRWKYSESYKASRYLLEQSITKYPTLEYFIDIHRDSLTRDKTTITINDKNYAKILFIVGMENSNYQENLSFTEKINNIINEQYPTLSKGIYKKSGPGVNGVYNQDFNSKTILIEIGGFQNTPEEVLNTAVAFTNCFLEAINE